MYFYFYLLLINYLTQSKKICVYMCEWWTNLDIKYSENLNGFYMYFKLECFKTQANLMTSNQLLL